MKMKKVISLAMALLFTVSVCGCKNATSDDSEYSVWYEDEIINSTTGGNGNNGGDADNADGANLGSGKNDKNNSSSGKNNSGKNNNTSTGKNNTTGGNGGSDKKDDSQKAEDIKLDFGGKTITLLRDWDKYSRGKYTTWDNWLNNLEQVEKECKVKIVEKKWTANLAGEMLAGVKPEGNIYLVSSGDVYGLATKGYIADLNDAMKKTGINMTGELFSDFNTQLNNINGKQYTIGLGFARVPAVILYNKTMTKKAGYDIAALVKNKQWTWDKMTEVAKKCTVTSSSGQVTTYGIGFGTNAFAALAVSNNSHVIFPDSNGKFTMQLGNKQTDAALQQLYEWANVDKVATYNWGNRDWRAIGTDFANKKIAMVFADHDTENQAYASLKDEWGVAYLPMGPNATEYVSYLQDEYSYVIPATYKDMAADLLVLLTKMHRLPSGYTVDDEFRDEWIRYFKDKDSYNMWKSLHDGTVKQVWDGSNKLAPSLGGTSYATALGQVFQGELTVGAFNDTYKSGFQTNLNDATKKIRYTGSLK